MKKKAKIIKYTVETRYVVKFLLGNIDIFTEKDIHTEVYTPESSGINSANDFTVITSIQEGYKIYNKTRELGKPERKIIKITKVFARIQVSELFNLEKNKEEKDEKKS